VWRRKGPCFPGAFVRSVWLGRSVSPPECPIQRPRLNLGKMIVIGRCRLVGRGFITRALQGREAREKLDAGTAGVTCEAFEVLVQEAPLYSIAV